MNTIIEFTDVALAFRRNVLFSDVNLRVETGGGYALRGPNGSGKSALLRLMCRMMTPTRGSVHISPDHLAKDATFPAAFGVAIDGPAYIAGLSGFDNLRELAAIRRVINKDQIRATMLEFGLDPESRTRVGRYSLGMKQKLSLSQAVMESPTVLLLDEPFNALDDTSVEILRNRLHEFRAQGGTLVVTSHDPQHLATLVDTTFTIDGGSVRTST